MIHLPRVANFDDFDPLRREPSVRLRYVSSVDELGEPDLVILPGTRATIADLEFLRSRGLDQAIRARVEGGAHVLGICGGYQMLGEWLHDPEGVEAPAGTEVAGLGLLPVLTSFAGDKQTVRVSGSLVGSVGLWASAAGAAVEGYEIHMGQSGGEAAPLLELDGQPDGAISANGRVAGTYLHGLFDNDELRRGLLAGLGADTSEGVSASEGRDREFDRLAAVVRKHVDLEAIRALLWPA